MKKNIVVFDLDGTICLNDHRQHLIDIERAKFEYLLNSGVPNLISKEELELAFVNWKKDWGAFYDACDKDLPNNPVIQILRFFSIPPYEIHLFTGRVERVRQKTITWLNKHHIPAINLRMRPDSNRQDDYKLKEEWLREIGGPERVFCVFEDCQSVVDMWRSHGIVCFQVAPGNF